jgi:hypothetical protein
MLCAEVINKFAAHDCNKFYNSKQQIRNPKNCHFWANCQWKLHMMFNTQDYGYDGAFTWLTGNTNLFLSLLKNKNSELKHCHTDILHWKLCFSSINCLIAGHFFVIPPFFLICAGFCLSEYNTFT